MAFVDESVQACLHGHTAEYWASLLTINGGDQIRDATPIHTASVGRRLKWSNCLRLACFVFLALLPLPWVWRRDRRIRC
jgi:hypothetical protein